MFSGLRGVLLIGVAALPFTACTNTPPPPPPEAPVAAVVVQPPVARPPATGRWAFDANGACTAAAAGGGLSLEVAVAPERVSFVFLAAPATALPAGKAVTVAWSGGSGSWSATGRASGPRRIVVAAPMSEVQASRVLFLLDGGTVRVDGVAGVPALRVPNAGQPGNAWFDCVRKALRGVMHG